MLNTVNDKDIRVDSKIMGEELQGRINVQNDFQEKYMQN